PPAACCFFLLMPPPPSSTLFPYTTLFRSPDLGLPHGHDLVDAGHVHRPSVDGPAGELERPGPDGVGLVERVRRVGAEDVGHGRADRKSTRLNSSHVKISYAVFCLKKKKKH